jgi:hypothetical protein
MARASKDVNDRTYARTLPERRAQRARQRVGLISVSIR